ncbi:MAG: hypothetical protein DCC75_03330 [Proteobacteria bacterium]|nr:MAG: hypothetical protein DCC75_03330 [Pseudomonadota bacterium]
MILRPIMLFLALPLVIATLVLSTAQACPLIGGLVDLNCDGEINISVLGDSLVSGIGDTKNDNQGGYVLRAARRLPQLEIHNLGVAGQNTRQLLMDLNQKLKSGSDNSTKSALMVSDLVFIDLGRNDRWFFGLPLATYRNLKRIRDVVKNRVNDLSAYKPFVVMAVLMLPNRGSQGPWVKELNSIILKKSRASNPNDLRFDLVSKRLLSSDQIHPTPDGYDALAKVFVSYISSKKLRTRMVRAAPDPPGAE